MADVSEPETQEAAALRAGSSWRLGLKFRAAFFSGLLVTVPVAATLFIIWFMVSWIDQMQPSWLFGRSIPGLGIVLVVVGIFSVGLLTQNWLGVRTLRAYEGLVQRVPVVSSVYQGVKQVVEATLSDDERSVRGVVLVEWPRPGAWSIGFHTGDAFVAGDDGTPHVCVFLPSTPNPTTGFFFMVAEDQVVKTELTVEEAARLLMSAGISGAVENIVVPMRNGVQHS